MMCYHSDFETLHKTLPKSEFQKVRIIGTHLEDWLPHWTTYIFLQISLLKSSKWSFRGKGEDRSTRSAQNKTEMGVLLQCGSIPGQERHPQERVNKTIESLPSKNAADRKTHYDVHYFRVNSLAHRLAHRQLQSGQCIRILQLIVE